MQRLFAQTSQVGEHEILIDGTDVNHIKNVLRMKPGEEISVNDGSGKTYQCRINRYSEGKAVLDIQSATETDTELPSRICLFQGLPKGDKMEWIIQKAVELGAWSIIPFRAKRSVVKLDEKKAAKRQARWQAIAKGAAEQSGRGVIPEVAQVMTFQDALRAAGDLDVLLIPYELEKGMEETSRTISRIRAGQSVGIFIGPEGGFEQEEVERAREAGAVPISLGKRILRTETAGVAVLSVLMYQLESQEHNLVIKKE